MGEVTMRSCRRQSFNCSFDARRGRRGLGGQLQQPGSRDYGKPFGAIFKDYGFDFYKIDPMLFRARGCDRDESRVGTHVPGWRSERRTADAVVRLVSARSMNSDGGRRAPAAHSGACELDVAR